MSSATWSAAFSARRSWSSSLSLGNRDIASAPCRAAALGDGVTISVTTILLSAPTIFISGRQFDSLRQPSWDRKVGSAPTVLAAVEDLRFRQPRLGCRPASATSHAFGVSVRIALARPTSPWPSDFTKGLARSSYGFTSRQVGSAVGSGLGGGGGGLYVGADVDAEDTSTIRSATRTPRSLASRVRMPAAFPACRGSASRLITPRSFWTRERHCKQSCGNIDAPLVRISRIIDCSAVRAFIDRRMGARHLDRPEPTMLIAAKHDVAVVLVDMVEDDDAKQNALLLYPVLDGVVVAGGDRIGVVRTCVELRQADLSPEISYRSWRRSRNRHFGQRRGTKWTCRGSRRLSWPTDRGALAAEINDGVIDGLSRALTSVQDWWAR